MGFPGDILKTPNARTANDRHDRAPSGGNAALAFDWVPIRSLAERHRPRILAHLLALPQADRYLRFGYPASDVQLARYADLIDFSRDEVFGIFSRRLQLLAMAHLALMPAGANGQVTQAEFGVSVLPRARSRGFGSRLFERAVLHARNRHIDTMVIHALSENTAMLRIVRKAGASVVRDGGESQACLRLPRDDLMSHVDELIGDRAAEIDYGLKVHARRLDGLLDALDEVKGRYADGARPASE